MNLVAPHSHAVSDTERELDHNYTVAALGVWVTVRKGFCTDGASIPRVLWRVVGHPFQGLAEPAAVIHDALYQSESVPREQADAIFRYLLLANGVNKAKAWVMYWGVRAGGYFVWRNHDESDVAMAKKLVVVK